MRHATILIGLAVLFPAAAVSQPLNPQSLTPNGNPAGITLVPGSVAIPGVSGAANTGTIPLPGTAGSLTVPTAPDTGVSGALYPPAYYSSVPPTGTLQNTLPQASEPALSPTLNVPSVPPPGGIPTCLNVRTSYLCQR
jgi:hypothetical protein